MAKRTRAHAALTTTDATRPASPPELPRDLWGEVAQWLLPDAAALLGFVRTCTSFWDLGLLALRPWLAALTELPPLPLEPRYYGPSGGAAAFHEPAEVVCALQQLALYKRGADEVDKEGRWYQWLYCALSLLANAQTEALVKRCGVVECRPLYWLEHVKGADLLKDVFYRDTAKAQPQPLLAHPKLRVARQGAGFLKRARKRCARLPHDQRDIYTALLNSSMSTPAKRALCYTIGRERIKLERAGPLDKMHDVVLGGEHLFSTLGERRGVRADTTFWLCRANEPATEKLRAVRLSKEKGSKGRKSSMRLQLATLHDRYYDLCVALSPTFARPDDSSDDELIVVGARPGAMSFDDSSSSEDDVDVQANLDDAFRRAGWWVPAR